MMPKKEPHIDNEEAKDMPKIEDPDEKDLETVKSIVQPIIGERLLETAMTRKTKLDHVKEKRIEEDGVEKLEEPVTQHHYD